MSCNSVCSFWGHFGTIRFGMKTMTSWRNFCSLKYGNWIGPYHLSGFFFIFFLFACFGRVCVCAFDDIFVKSGNSIRIMKRTPNSIFNLASMGPIYIPFDCEIYCRRRDWRWALSSICTERMDHEYVNCDLMISVENSTSSCNLFADDLPTEVLTYLSPLFRFCFFFLSFVFCSSDTLNCLFAFLSFSPSLYLFDVNSFLFVSVFSVHGIYICSAQFVYTCGYSLP